MISTPSRPSRRLAFPMAALMFRFALWSLPAAAQSVIPQVTPDSTVDVEQIEAAITAVEAQQGLDEETRTRVVDQLRDAQAQIRNRLASEAAAAEFAAAPQTAPQRTEELRKQLAEPAPPPPTADSLGIGPSTSLSELEQKLALEQAQLTAAESQLSELESRIAIEENRPEQARQRIAELRRSRDEMTRRIDAPPAPNERAVVTDARRLVATLRRDALGAEIRQLEQELLSHSVRHGLLQVRRDLAERALGAQRTRITVLVREINERRQASARLATQAAAMSELASADAHPVVREIVEENVALARELPSIAEEIERATRQYGEIEEQARDIESDFARSRQRLEIGGISQAIGQLFAEERRNLPRVSQYRAEVRARRDALATIGLAQVRIDEQRRELTPLDERIDAAMAEVAKDVASGEELASVEDQIRRLLQNRRDLLDQAGATYTSYLRALGDLDVAQRRLLNAADDYKEFLDQHLLWIPSAPVVGLDTIKNLFPAIRWVLSPRSWAEVTSALIQGTRSRPVAASFAVLLLGLAFVAMRPLRSRYRLLNGKVGRLSTDHIGLTLGTIAIIALRAVPVPLTLFVGGWALIESNVDAGFTAAVSRALFAVAPFLYNVTLYRMLCAADGVAQKHFGWPADRLATARRQLDRLAVVGAPIIFVTVVVYASPFGAYRDSLARLAFVVLMIILSSTLGALFRPASEIRGTADGEAAPRSVASRLRHLWYALAVAAPLLLAAIAVLGYLYTAVILTGHLVDTFWLVLGLVVVNLVVLRWLTLTRRKIAWRLALEKREARRAEGAKQEDEEQDSEIPVVERKPIDLDTVDQQSRRLLHAGLVFVGVLAAWGIWSGVLPALTILEEISLWSQTTTVDGQESVVPVTLADLLLAVVIAVVTFVASRNLPGLMEIAILQRLTLQPGSRYAINTLVRYVVVTVGAVFVLSIIGWNWSQIQWLVAALSVGLGFGLQEIVANFVSGLIILFERPVRVGDTVTVGELNGTVSQLRIRATTIRDWDRKEIIVPNKSFITEQVVNWTLSDPITRLVIPVGIAYGSDVKLAHRVMQDALRALPLVLDDPEPKVYFMGFGDSSLDFNLYVYSRELSDRLPLMHAVHEEILTALREHDVEIPFPQRDLHLRSVDEDITMPATKTGTVEND